MAGAFTAEAGLMQGASTVVGPTFPVANVVAGAFSVVANRHRPEWAKGILDRRRTRQRADSLLALQGIRHSSGMRIARTAIRQMGTSERRLIRPLREV